jgi:hypothetical protein
MAHAYEKLAPTSSGNSAETALAFAMSDDAARAEALADDLNKTFPLDTQMQALWLPAIHAQLAPDALEKCGPNIPILKQAEYARLD